MMASDWQEKDLVYRQVHPSHAPDGVPSSQAFNPTPKDADKLSVDDSRIVSAEESWKHFTQKLGFSSRGTWAVTAGEINDAGDLQLLADPVENDHEPDKSNPAHSSIDFSKVESKGQKKKKAQQLAMAAQARGIQHDPES